MSKPKAPEPPDPKTTAAAQTGTNVSTAIANAQLGNVNQVTPYGSLTYKQTGQQFVNDANGGKWYIGPNGQYTQTKPTAPVASTAASSAIRASGTPAQKASGGGNAQLNGPTGGTDMGGGGTVQPNIQGGGGAAGGGLPTGWREANGYYIPSYTATQTLSPTQQAIFDASQGAQINLANVAKEQSGRLGSLLNRPMDLSKLPAGGNAANLTMPSYQQFSSGNPLQTQIASAGSIAKTFGDAGNITKTYGTDFSKDRQRVEDALMSRLNTQLDKDRANQEASLANQGIRLGSTGYSNAQADFGRNVNDARMSAILGAGEEQTRLANLERDRAVFQNSAQQQLYDQNLGRATFGNQAQQQQFGQNASRAAFSNDATQQMNDNRFRATGANNSLQDQRLNAQLTRFNAQNTQRNQALQETFATRNQPLNEIAALLSGSQLQSPQWVNSNMPTIPTVDYAGLVNTNYNQKLGAWQQQNAQSQGLLGGLLGLGGRRLSKPALSDDKAKTDKERLGDLGRGMGLWSYRYKDDGKDKPKRVGLMASEVEKAVPEAVSRRRDGLRQVDYGKALGGLFAMGAAHG